MTARPARLEEEYEIVPNRGCNTQPRLKPADTGRYPPWSYKYTETGYPEPDKEKEYPAEAGCLFSDVRPKPPIAAPIRRRMGSDKEPAARLKPEWIPEDAESRSPISFRHVPLKMRCLQADVPRKDPDIQNLKVPNVPLSSETRRKIRMPDSGYELNFPDNNPEKSSQLYLSSSNLIEAVPDSKSNRDWNTSSSRKGATAICPCISISRMELSEAACFS